jgi:hypothetical protein
MARSLVVDVSNDERKAVPSAVICPRLFQCVHVGGDADDGAACTAEEPSSEDP